MDTSEQYITMCEKAREIQKVWEPQEGDWAFYYDGGCSNNSHVICGHILSRAPDKNFGTLLRMSREAFREVMGNTRYWMKRKDNKFDVLTGVYVWLPRQDQLQAMVMGGSEFFPRLNDRFRYWYDGEIDQDGERYHWTGEQLWLAFVMHEKHLKRWDGEEWKEAQ